jgi:DNA-binding LacI/PurR family transcriptional regulator
MAGTIGHVNEKNVMPDLLSVLNSPCDAVVLVDPREQIRTYLSDIMPFYKPVITMGIYPAPNVDCVEIDMIPAVTAALDHLLASNPRRLAFFGFGSAEEATGVIRDALEGRGDPRVIKYVNVMNEVGRPIEVIHGSHSGRRANIELLQDYVRGKGCPDAIMCYDDEHAISAHYGLRHMGYKLPDDALIVGMDGNEECEYLEPPVSTIVMPIDEMCAQAWEFLNNRFSGRADGRQYVQLNADLVIRESSLRSEERCFA